MKKIKIFIFIIITLFCAESVFSHTLWINLTDHNPKYYERFGAFTKSYFGWGHKYPVDGFIKAENLVEFTLTGKDGKKTDIETSQGGFLASEINLKNQGTYWVGAVKKPGFYTMYEKNGKIMHKSEPMTGLDGIILSTYFQEFSKALINTGIYDHETLVSPLNHKIEIIPLINPGEIKEGEILKVQVLFQGKPERYIQVLGTYNGFSNQDDFAFATVTDNEGIAEIRILKKGNQLLKVHKKAAPKKELEGKCLYESYKATLSFEIQ
ncbi:MAG: DUF4198 domain-containing protein [Desulfobacteraceae bacterium]|nr:DUF4198 domain-containing protein [Desulfobacteraceae bacterium]